MYKEEFFLRLIIPDLPEDPMVIPEMFHAIGDAMEDILTQPNTTALNKKTGETQLVGFIEDCKIVGFGTLETGQAFIGFSFTGTPVTISGEPIDESDDGQWLDIKWRE